MSLEFSVEAYSDAIEEMRLLYPAHWAELSHDRDTLPLDVNYAGYEALEASGALLTAVARSEGVLVGYHLLVLKAPITSQESRMAYGSLLYIKPRFRKGFNGVRFLKYAEAACRNAGAKGVYISSTTRRPFGKLLERLGFAEVERTFFKVL